MASGAIPSPQGPAAHPSRDERDLCAITLEIPWTGSKDGSLTFRFGSEMSEVEEDAEFAFVGKASIAGQRAARVFKKGAPILYGPMVAGENQENTVHAPVAAAKHLFGDWSLPADNNDNGNPYYTQVFEKDRVATIWGGFKTKDHGINPKWEDIDPRPIGPPNVPHVAVRLLDSRGGFKKNKDGSEFVYRPHEAYDYYSQFNIESPAKKVILPDGKSKNNRSAP